MLKKFNFYFFTDLPFDPSSRLIWAALAGDSKLSATVLDILLDVISQNQVQVPAQRHLSIKS
jgi:hypothetical protein